jgi:mannose-6-phosphate isomerase-like protein (cupin superfamily)
VIPATINFAEKLARIDAPWSPRVVAELNDYQFKLVKIHGTVTLRAGEMTVVPRGVEHRPHADDECHVLLIEPRGVVNTGDAGGPRTAPNDVWT